MNSASDRGGPAPVFETDSTLRQGHVGAYLLAGFLIVCYVVAIIRLSWHWIFPILPAAVAIVANTQVRWAITYKRVLGWLLLVGLGIAGSITLCLILIKAGS